MISHIKILPILLFLKALTLENPRSLNPKKLYQNQLFIPDAVFQAAETQNFFSSPLKQKSQRTRISKHFALTLFIRAASSRNLFLSLVPLPERREPKTFLLARFRVAQAANHDVPVGRPRAPLFQPFGALHNASLKLLFVLLSLSDGIPTEHASRLFEELFPFFLFATLSS